LSIPYDNGWKASVDGKSVKIHKVVGNLMAIDLKAGSHKVVMKYQVPGLKIGWIISIIAAALFVAFLFFIRKKNK